MCGFKTAQTHPNPIPGNHILTTQPHPCSRLVARRWLGLGAAWLGWEALLGLSLGVIGGLVLAGGQLLYKSEITGLDGGWVGPGYCASTTLNT
jgi:hypothetical protein